MELLSSIKYQEDKEVLLPLPTFSAKKQNGKRMYKDARKGTAEIIDKPMKLYDFEVLDYRFPLLKLRCDVGSGTYIRSIGYRLGKELGLGGALVELKRTRVGEWFLNDISEEHLAKGNIKGEMRKIFYKEVFLD